MLCCTSYTELQEYGLEASQLEESYVLLRSIIKVSRHRGEKNLDRPHPWIKDFGVPYQRV